MTDAPSLLAECSSRGIRLSLDDGGGLEIDAPQDALTTELLDRLKAHKAELLAILRPKPSTPELPGRWRERIVHRRGGPVVVLERIDPPQQFPWLSDVDFEDLPEPWRP